MAVIGSTAPAPTNRVCALDALRGFAILAMLLSGQIESSQHLLPAWMYHAQDPPPDFKTDVHLPGISWVDLVFPFFLFAMGAAFPLALSRRMPLAQQIPWRSIPLIFERGLMLGFFALYVQAIRPYEFGPNPDTGVLRLALLGFFLLFPAYSRLPEDWPAVLRWGLKLAGWLGMILFLALVNYPKTNAHGPHFSLYRSDIILIVLTNMAVSGALVWMFTRDNLLPRLGIMGLLLAIRLSNMPDPGAPGWVNDLWRWTQQKPAPWLFQLYYLQYLLIVIPGTIAGDLFLRWSRARLEPSADTKSAWSPPRYCSVAVIMFLMPILVLIGLKARWLLPTTLLVFGMCVLGLSLLVKPGNATERLYADLFKWAVYWLILGLVFEPYEGGIKKSHPTISYYFVTSGLAGCALIGFSIIADVFQHRRWLEFLITNGQNPMIAYAGINNFILPILALTGLGTMLDNFASTPWLYFCRGAVITLLLAFTVHVLTRRKIFWRT